MKVYRGSAAAARTYVEADRSRADDYYLAEGSGVASRYVATSSATTSDLASGVALGVGGPRRVGLLDGDAYEVWVAGYDPVTGVAKGRLRTDEKGVRFVEVVVNGPKTWSLAAALHPEVAEAYDVAQERAAGEVIGWLAEHATTRVGPRGRQVQVPVEEIEAAVIRHYTSRAGDPHRHLHLQINARVWAERGWRGIHTVGVRDSLDAINGIGHAAVMCDPQFRTTLAAYGYTLDLDSGEVDQLRPYVGAFSTRTAQIARNVDGYEATWRAQHPEQEPGPRLRRAWDTRAWAQARPDKVTPIDGAEIGRRWVAELYELGFRPPFLTTTVHPARVGGLDRAAAVETIMCRLGARRSAWNAADVRGETEHLIAGVGVVADPVVRRELAEDLTHRTVEACSVLVPGDAVPEHVRALTSPRVLAVEADLTTRLATRAVSSVVPWPWVPASLVEGLDPGQRGVVAALAGSGDLLVIEGPAGAGKTTTLAAAGLLLATNGHRLVVATATLKAAQVAAQHPYVEACSAAWLAHQHGFRWDDDGRWTRTPPDPDGSRRVDPGARLRPGDVLLVDEAAMLDQDTAHALFTLADDTGSRLALVGDRHQLPAVGRGGVLDLATRWAPPQARLELGSVHRFTDPDYAALSLAMRTGEHPSQRAGERHGEHRGERDEGSGAVFDALVARGEVVIYASDLERLVALTTLATLPTAPDQPGALVIADTREQVTQLNAAIRDRLIAHGRVNQRHQLTTTGGEQVGIGDRVATRHNDRDLEVANRDTWTITAVRADGAITVNGRRGERVLPADYVRDHVELAYACTVYGAQGDTVTTAHLLVGEHTGAAAAYVGMTRGRTSNTAHLVADTTDDARRQWIEIFNRDRADLGPTHATQRALDDINRYGPNASPPKAWPPLGLHTPQHLPEPYHPATASSEGIGR